MYAQEFDREKHQCINASKLTDRIMDLIKEKGYRVNKTTGAILALGNDGIMYHFLKSDSFQTFMDLDTLKLDLT